MRETEVVVTDLADFARVAAEERGLCVVTTLRDDSTIQASVVNAGVGDHPVSGAAGVVLVAAGGSRKLANLRRRPRTTVVARSGWQWAAVEGGAELIGPDDPVAGMSADALRLALRAAFVAAGGTHDDWDEYDRVMAAERRAIVFVTPDRVYSNG
jgi:PPOX class probable F420-dependent enzyme